MNKGAQIRFALCIFSPFEICPYKNIQVIIFNCNKFSLTKVNSNPFTVISQLAEKKFVNQMPMPYFKLLYLEYTNTTVGIANCLTLLGFSWLGEFSPFTECLVVYSLLYTSQPVLEA